MSLAIIDTILSPIFKTIDKIIPDKDQRDKLKFELQTMEFKRVAEELNAQKEIITAEAKSQHWLVSAWRPILMLLFGVIIFNNYILYPYLSLFFAKAPILEIPPDMWELLKIGIGGYIVGRSTEKTIEVFKRKNG